MTRPRAPLAATTAALAVALGVGATLVPRAERAKGGPSPSLLSPGGGRLELAPASEAAGFARALEPRPFVLPDDHGPHFAYQTEWWYYTGNLSSGDGGRYGFQLTFFRRGLTPGPPPAGAGLATNQVYFAHFAITDVAGRRHVAAERFARGAAGLGGASGRPYAVWLEGWRAGAVSADGSRVRLTAGDSPTGLFLDLALEARKPLVSHGDRGLSPKSGEPGNASYYVGYTRLSARGTVGVGERQEEVAGEAWFDHEWSTSALGAGAVGWDWFSLQLDDGRELMHFRIRREDGGVEDASSGTLVLPDGRTRRIGREDVAVRVLDQWRSPATGAVYPSRWRLRLPGERLELLVEPRLADQEMRTSFVYWEGAVAVSGTADGRPVAGQGYVELTGYGGSMQGVF